MDCPEPLTTMWIRALAFTTHRNCNMAVPWILNKNLVQGKGPSSMVIAPIRRNYRFPQDQICFANLVELTGFEPVIAECHSAVIPLHHSPNVSKI